MEGGRNGVKERRIDGRTDGWMEGGRGETGVGGTEEVRQAGKEGVAACPGG